MPLKRSQIVPLVVGFLLAGQPALAQQGAQAPRGASQAATLPPALIAAINSGNADMVRVLIQRLSAGRPPEAARLAAQVVMAAERIATTNPVLAVRVVAAALPVLEQPAIGRVAPNEASAAVSAAMRLISSPAILAAQPEQVAALGLSAANVAGSLGNPSLSASVANGLATVSERLPNAQPAMAAQLAARAMEVASQPSVLTAAPQQAMQVATIVARVVVNPSVQRAAPQLVASVAVGMAAMVTTPAVYQASPSAALAVMTAANAATQAPAVAAAVPSAAQSVASTLSMAAASTLINAANPAAAAQINALLESPRAPDEPSLTGTTPQQLIGAPSVNIPSAAAGGGSSPASPS